MLVGTELVQLALEQESVGAEIDEAPALDQPLRDGGNLRMEQRLPACDADDGRLALLGSAQAVFYREILLEDGDGVLDLSASGAGEIAAEERFQHEHQWILLATREPLLEDVLRHRRHLCCRDRHALLRSLTDGPRTCTCFRMPRGIAGFGDSARNPCSSGYGIPAPNGSCHPRGAAAIANFPQKGFIGRRSLPRFQIEDVPGERPAIRFGQIRELHHRGTRDAFSERLEDLADALSLAKFLRGEVARPRIEPARGGTVARTTLAVARDTVDGVGRLPLLDELRRPFRRLAGRRGRAREGECAEDRASEKTGTAHLRETEPGGSGARGERGGGRSAGKLRAR